MAKMTKVRVVAPMGVRLRAPFTVALTEAQYELRRAVLGAKFQKRFTLESGALEFKRGEEFGVADAGKLHRDQFEDVDALAKAEAEAEAEAKAKAEADAKADAEAEAKAKAEADAS